jgi:uncharacterized protein YlxP (DUF503 family)
MVVGVCTLELEVPGSRSLKDKRRVVRGVVQRLRNRFNASVLEVDGNSLWNRATLAVAVIAHSEIEGREVLEHIQNHVEDYRPGLLTDSHVEFY